MCQTTVRTLQYAYMYLWFELLPGRSQRVLKRCDKSVDGSVDGPVDGPMSMIDMSMIDMSMLSILWRGLLRIPYLSQDL